MSSSISLSPLFGCVSLFIIQTVTPSRKGRELYLTFFFRRGSKARRSRGGKKKKGEHTHCRSSLSVPTATAIDSLLLLAFALLLPHFFSLFVVRRKALVLLEDRRACGVSEERNSKERDFVLFSLRIIYFCIARNRPPLL